MIPAASRLWPFAFLAIAAFAARAEAHPGAGIVADARGNVYFVLFGSHHLMKLDRAGRATIFASDERLSAPHHLTLGPDGSLFVASDNDGRVWRVDSAGRLSLHLDSKPLGRTLRGLQVGAWGDPFTVDADGAVYALAEPNGPALVRIDPDGGITRLGSRARFGLLHFRGMALGRDRSLFLTDAGTVWRIRGDSADRISSRDVILVEPAGIAVDSLGNMLVADYHERRIIGFAADGAVNTPAPLARARFRGPTGVAARGDTTYVLDHAPGSAAVWRIAGDDVDRIYTQSFLGWHARTMFASLPLLLLALLWANRVERRRRARRAPAA